MSFLRKYKPFRDWASSLFENSLSDYFLPSKHVVISSPHFTITKSPKHFKNAGNTTLHDLTESLTQLQEYLSRAQRQNGIVFNRTKELNAQDVEQLRMLNYFSKISDVNKSIQENYNAVEVVIHYVLKKLIASNMNSNIDDRMQDQLKSICAEFGYALNDDNELVKAGEVVIMATSKSNQGRVNEAMAHFCRDWSPSFQCEREPLTEFLYERLSNSSLSKDNSTLIVVPGAGAGQLSNFIAQKFPKFTVESIEWSSLMYIFNEFALDHGKDVKIRPFCQYYSGHINSGNQTRSMNVQLSKVKRPSNLTVHWGDFREYTTNDTRYKQIVVCTAFFIDTAENIFEYFKAIEDLKHHCDELHWINIGPLKYGTRPLVQLTAAELKRLRRLRGWHDIYEGATTKYEQQLNGYLTDYESLYQGYYGLLRFHSVIRNTSRAEELTL